MPKIEWVFSVLRDIEEYLGNEGFEQTQDAVWSASLALHLEASNKRARGEVSLGAADKPRKTGQP